MSISKRHHREEEVNGDAEPNPQNKNREGGETPEAGPFYLEELTTVYARGRFPAPSTFPETPRTR